MNEFEAATAAYHAARRGSEVGEDFYDVWQTDGDSFQVTSATASKVAA
jgi:hypothetical protein